MDDDKHDDTTSPSGSSRKRTPPTIDLTASSVSDSATVSDDSNASAASSSNSKVRKSWRDRLRTLRASVTPSFRWSSTLGIRTPKPARAALSSMLVAGVIGAVVALLTMCAFWFWDSSGGSNRILSRLPQTTTKSDRGPVGKQTTKVESRAANSTSVTSPDSDLATRIDTLEKSVTSLRDEVAATRATLEEIKGAPAPQIDTSAIEDRVSKIERATIALTGEVGSPQKFTTDDPRLRRVAIAAMLDTAVNRGEPYAVALSSAKSAAEDASVLKPLDEFADKGLPTASALSRELIGLLPQLPSKASASTQPSGLLDRIAQSASKMFRIRRVDDDETASIAARAESAARRDDLVAARREVESLSALQRAPLASWIERVDAREAALAASRQFSAGVASALPKSAQ